MYLKGKTVVITGASSGIGEACAYAFAQQGCNVVIAARSEDKLLKIAAELTELGCSCLTVICDVQNEQDCQNLMVQTVQKYKHIDILINNAGISMRALFKDLNLKVLEQLMQTNFWGAVYCTKYALPELLKSKGSIIAVNSWAGFTGLPARTGYNASKFALLGFMESLRVENLTSGLHIGTIFPGYTSSNIRNAALNKFGSKQQDSPLDESKLMKPAQVAKHIVQMVIKRKKYQVLTFKGKLMYWINKVFPNYIDRQVYKVVSKEKNSSF